MLILNFRNTMKLLIPFIGIHIFVPISANSSRKSIIHLRIFMLKNSLGQEKKKSKKEAEKINGIENSFNLHNIYLV